MSNGRSRCGFVVVKLRIDDEDFLLMRRDKDWGDVTFIGGHEAPRDSGDLKRAARRESLEEVPSLRKFKGLSLEPLTEEIDYGPIFSRSAKRDVLYTLRFFRLVFGEAPDRLITTLGRKSPNILVRQDDVVQGQRHKIAGLAAALDRMFPGGLDAVPHSWPHDLGHALKRNAASPTAQPELALDTPKKNNGSGNSN